MPSESPLRCISHCADLRPACLTPLGFTWPREALTLQPEPPATVQAKPWEEEWTGPVQGGPTQPLPFTTILSASLAQQLPCCTKDPFLGVASWLCLCLLLIQWGFFVRIPFLLGVGVQILSLRRGDPSGITWAGACPCVRQGSMFLPLFI